MPSNTHPTHDEIDADELAAIARRLDRSAGLFIGHARTDVTRLPAEVHRLRQAVEHQRLAHGYLLAAARATIAAHRDGEADPIAYLHDQLDHCRQLPAPHEQLTGLAAHTRHLGSGRPAVA